MLITFACPWRIRTHAATGSSKRPPQCFSQVKLRNVVGCAGRVQEGSYEKDGEKTYTPSALAISLPASTSTVSGWFFSINRLLRSMQCIGRTDSKLVPHPLL